MGSRAPDTQAAARAQQPVSVSVVIPAHDEALTLPRCFQCLLNQDYPGKMRVIVIDNGSTDGTFDVAAQWKERFDAVGHELLPLRLEVGNKPGALNAGDAAAVGQCRIYLDADTEISSNCIRAIAAALADGSGVGICCAQMEVPPARSWFTRRYGRVWSQLPWVRDDVIGAGLYAVSAAGRKRWTDFPNIIADDMWAQAQFQREERRVIPDASFVVRLPDGLRNLIHVRTRWIRGNRELEQYMNASVPRVDFPLAGRIQWLLRNPQLWPDLPLYFAVNTWVKWRARSRQEVGTRHWERGRPKSL